MTDDQLRALCGVLEASAKSGATPMPHVLYLALQVTDAFLKARTAYRQCHGGHKDDCNSYMGWGNNTQCDCPHNTLKATLLGGASACPLAGHSGTTESCRDCADQIDGGHY